MLANYNGMVSVCDMGYNEPELNSSCYHPGQVEKKSIMFCECVEVVGKDDAKETCLGMQR